MDQGRRKLYLLLLGLAALGLVIDRFVLTESATAPKAASAETGVPLAALALRDEGQSPSMSIPEIPFPQGLQTAASTAPILDLFARPEVRLAAQLNAGLSHNQSLARSESSLSGRLGGTLFRRRHKLDGVLVQQRLKMAVLDGRPVRIGDSVDGCTLRSVSGYEAVFECEDGPTVLKLKDVGDRSQD